MKWCDLQSNLQNLTNKKITISELADAIGETRQTMHKRVTLAKKDVPEDILHEYERYYNVVFSPELLSEEIKLDYYPEIFGSCGSGIFELSSIKEQICISKNILFAKYSSIKHYSIINARGNSMAPFILDKDKLVVQHWEGEQIIDNCTYIFCYSDEIFIKRLVKNINQLVIISANKDYDTIKLTGADLENVHIIGQIVGILRDTR